MRYGKHEEILRLSCSLIEQNPKVFEPLLFSTTSLEEHVKNNKITETWAETLDIVQFFIAQFVPTQRHRKSGAILNPL